MNPYPGLFLPHPALVFWSRSGLFFLCHSILRFLSPPITPCTFLWVKGTNSDNCSHPSNHTQARGLQLGLPHRSHLHHTGQWLCTSAYFLQLETTCSMFVDVLTHLGLLEEPTTRCLGWSGWGWGWDSPESEAQGEASVLPKLLGDRFQVLLLPPHTLESVFCFCFLPHTCQKFLFSLCTFPEHNSPPFCCPQHPGESLVNRTAS